MGGFLRLSRLIDGINSFIGYHIRWLILAAVVISAVNAIVRKVFDSSSNAWLELQWFLFGAVFLLAAPYVLLKNGHVRIDAVSQHFKQRTRDWIDLFGHVFFLLPLCLLMVWLGVPYFWDSLSNGESSQNAGGLIIWPSKLFILLGFVLLLAQVISEIIKSVATLRSVKHD
jgi:TRAP-type mannitol/chloroaromatic compound transport system permease small subunit